LFSVRLNNLNNPRFCTSAHGMAVDQLLLSTSGPIKRHTSLLP
jgi:hypothetical protein